MAFGGRRGELLVVIGCGMSQLDGVKLASYVTRVCDKIRCCSEQD